MIFQQEFNLAFGDKYQNLQLKNVVVKKNENALFVNFLYPSTDKELSAEQKQEITKWLKDKLNLEQLSLKVKFMRVFVEEKLIMKAIEAYFKSKYKLVTTYLNDKSFSVKITPIDVVVEVELSSRLANFFAEHKISTELAKVLQESFLVNFVVIAKENPELVDEVDIENVEMKATYKVTQRYEVQVIKDVVGKGISTKPEFLSYIKEPKANVVVAGYIKKIERREFIQKKGKNAGQPKAYYNFQIQDKKGKIDCIYFCSKTNERNMDKLEEFMFVLLQGDVKISQMGKLQLYVDKIALASELESEPEKKDVQSLGHVVEIEKITSLQQNSMFEMKKRYNSKIEGRTIVVFDIETTGLNEQDDQIIELGAVKIENGNIVEKFSSFVKPTKEIPNEVIKLTGITNEMVEDAPPIDGVLKDFYDFTRGCVLCGHNIINFDIKFIRREAENLGFVFDNQLIDTMHEAIAARLKISRYNLAAVLKVLGIVNEGAHRAWNDAYATAQVLLKLNEV